VGAFPTFKPACPQIGGPCRIQDEDSYMVCSGAEQKDVTEQFGGQRLVHLLAAGP
jgi:hypothetical protein